MGKKLTIISKNDDFKVALPALFEDFKKQKPVEREKWISAVNDRKEKAMIMGEIECFLELGATIVRMEIETVKYFMEHINPTNQRGKRLDLQPKSDASKDSAPEALTSESSEPVLTISDDDRKRYLDLIKKRKRAYYHNIKKNDAEDKISYLKSQGVSPNRASMFRLNMQSDFRKEGRKGNVECYTPPNIISMARDTMGGIDLDPCSCKYAQKYIKAKKYYTKETNGLNKRWSGKIWLNPPYMRKELTEFIDKLCSENYSQAIVLTNNNTETKWSQRLMELANVICFPEGRIIFWDENGPMDVTGPLQGQMIFGIKVDIIKFNAEFSPIGSVFSSLNNIKDVNN